MGARERREYGPHTFPLPAEVKAIFAEKVPDRWNDRPPWRSLFPQERAALLALQYLRVLALCEAALWGGTLPETAEGLAEVEGHAAEFTRQREAEVAEVVERARRPQSTPPTPPPTSLTVATSPPPEPEPEPAPVEPPKPKPFTPEELCWMLHDVYRDNQLVYNFWAEEFRKARTARNVDKMFQIAKVSKEARERRGFSWERHGAVRTQYPVGAD